MNQNTQFEHQAKAAAAALVNILTAITPLFLVVAILGVATVNGYLEYLHYSVVIGSAAWVPGMIFASIRFGSGLGGIHLFKSGRTMPGLFFLTVSIALTFWTSSHAGNMAVSIALSPGQQDNARVLIQTALWVALIGEVMIATYMGAHHSDELEKTATVKPSTVEPEKKTVKPSIENGKTVTPTTFNIDGLRPNGNGYGATNSATAADEKRVEIRGFSRHEETPAIVKTVTHSTVGKRQRPEPVAVSTDRVCLNCGTDISNKRSDAKFCSTDCRQEKWQKENAKTLKINE